MTESSKPSLNDIPVIPARCRLQWESAQAAHVLLYPEGMVKLSDSAAAILQLVNGKRSVAGIIGQLERDFPGVDLQADVLEFLDTAHQRGWIVMAARPASE
jgi:pyrroloquinoline quinone biosynthesis protein D